MNESPIYGLKKSLARAPFRVTPERAIELSDWGNENDVALKIVDVDDSTLGFMFQVDTQSKLISTSIESLEYLWSCVQMHMVFYLKYDEAQGSDSNSFDWANDPMTIGAIERFELSSDNLFSKKRINIWTNCQLIPPVNRLVETDTAIEELYLCCFAWIVHHELAHIRRGHGCFTAALSVTEEKEADRDALEWIVNIECPEKQKTKRMMSAVSALIALLELPMSRQKSRLDSHPATYERLDCCLNMFNLKENHEIYRYTAMVLQVHLARLGIYPVASGTYKEIYSEFLFERSRLEN